ncbi:MAG: Fe-S cluster assembly ATPase SufC [Alphaproteobacteria bacterium TMED89]|nr:Fe-S cluster assembly ATPase SufC [Rhodospirillaceae bacterium]RPH17078.1 MAG: Fe-S cluster assembly ATPase SufC [Alphaproteobacteria bacterium TMED89]
MLEIKGLHAGLEDGTEILKGINLSIGAGEVHAIMGPNGSGKSTTANILSGKPGYDVRSGSATLDGADLFEMEPEERAHAGLFQAFQYPVEIPGVQASTFLQTAVNAKRKVAGLAELDALAFVRELRAQAKKLGIGNDMLKRAVNVGFSGGEKKRFETLQMALLEPKLAVMDETDSGLDVDALRVVADGVNALRSPERSFLVITHYQRLLDYIVPDYVHILSDGKIVKSGDKSLALEVERTGYAEFEAA